MCRLREEIGLELLDHLAITTAVVSKVEDNRTCVLRGEHDFRGPGDRRRTKGEHGQFHIHNVAFEQLDVAEAEIRRAEEDRSGARDRIPLAADGVRAANDTLRLSEARFKAGTAIALEVIDAQDVLAQSRFNLARAIVDYNSAQARLLAASGELDRRSVLPNQGP